MPNLSKEAKIADVQELLQDTKAIVFADYRGLTATQIEKLRQSLDAVGAKFFVFKNTLLKIALRRSGYTLENQDVFDGPTAVLVSKDDMVESFKALHTFSKENELPTVKGGFLDGKAITAVEFGQIAQLPPIEILRAKLLGNLNAPLYNLAYVLKGTINQFVYTLKAVQEKKASEGVSSV